MQDACTMHMHRQTDRQTDIHRGQLPARSFFKLRAREEKPLNESNVCVICQHATTRMACYRCQKRMNQHLNDILKYRALVEAELLPGSAGDGRSSEQTIGLRVNALDFATGLTVVDVLESWERDWRNQFKLAAYGPASLERNQGKSQSTSVLVGVIAFLQSWMDKACDDHPAVDDFHRELDACWRHARSAANQQPRTAWRVTCPADTNEGECGNVLRVSGEDFDGIVTCKSCKTTWPTHRLLMVVVSSTEALLWIDKDAINTIVGLSASTLKQWGKEGRIRRQNGLYNFQDVLNVASGAI
jgi:hypothetical protein